MWYGAGLLLLGTWVTLIVTRSYLLAPLRARVGFLTPILDYFINCPICVGTWVGIILAVISYMGVQLPMALFIVPAVSTLSYILVLLVDLLSEILRWLAIVDPKHQETGK